MPVSRNRKVQKKKAQTRTKEIRARRKKVKQWVDELEKTFETLQSPGVPTFVPNASNGISLTPTPEIKEIVKHYDKMEI